MVDEGEPQEGCRVGDEGVLPLAAARAGSKDRPGKPLRITAESKGEMMGSLTVGQERRNRRDAFEEHYILEGKLTGLVIMAGWVALTGRKQKAVISRFPGRWLWRLLPWKPGSK